MKTLLAIATVISLSACGSTPRYESPTPLIDTKQVSSEKLTAFNTDKKECRAMQQKAMPTSLFDALAAPDVAAYTARREDKAADFMRRCLAGRGYQTLN